MNCIKKRNAARRSDDPEIWHCYSGYSGCLSLAVRRAPYGAELKPVTADENRAERKTGTDAGQRAAACVSRSTTSCCPLMRDSGGRTTCGVTGSGDGGERAVCYESRDEV